VTSYLQDYLEDVAFERLLLGKAVPVVPRDVGTSSGVYDLKNDHMDFAITVHETIGMTLDQAVIKLGIVPLAVGAAWKTIDVLMEYALDAQGHSPKKGRRWTIDEKVKHARQGHGDAPPLSSDPAVWLRLLGCYAALEEVRHSLTHRKATAQPNGDLVGVDRTGQPVQPMTQAEQFAFCRAASCLLAALETHSFATRERNEAMFHLDRMTAWREKAITGASERTYPIPQIEVTLDPPFELRLSALREKFLGKFGSHEVNLLVRFDGDPRCLLFELEATPAIDLMLDLAAPPQEPWCRSAS